MATPRVATCLFCDDIRFEMGGKLSFMGVYSGDISFSPALQFPVMLPKFAIAAWLIIDIDDNPNDVSVIIELPDGTDQFRVPLPVADNPPLEYPGLVDDAITKRKLFTAIPISPFPLPCEGLVQVWIEADGLRLRAGRLFVRNFPGDVATLPTASPPPS